MVQRRSRTPRATLVGASEINDTRYKRIDPLLDEILDEDWADMPGYYQGLTTIENMRFWGVDVTPQIARKCLLSHMFERSEMAKDAAQQRARILATQHPPIVYYMRLGNLVKIGFTQNLTRRLEVINPEEVLTTEPGGRERERERHRQFAALHAHGEWFRLEAPLTDHIEAVRREAAGE